jgi:hypothetical protein
MQRTSGRRSHIARRICSLRVAAARRILPSLPLAADP